MDDTSILVRLLFVLGVTFILVGTLTPGGDAAWNTFSDNLQNFPVFNDPGRQENRYTAFPDYPTLAANNSGGAAPQIVGCEATLTGRSYCINSRDGDNSYILMNATGTADAQYFTFNWTRNDFKNISADRLRSVYVEVQCRTVTGPAYKFQMTWAWNLVSDQDYQSCPVSNFTVSTVISFQCPNGCGTNTTFPWNSDPFAMAQVQPLGNAPGILSQARFTFIRIEIGITTSLGGSGTCKAPDGAWFAFADEVACAIANFAHQVWTGIQWVISGLIFVGEIIVYLLDIVVQFFAMVAYFLAIPGAPTIVQAIFTLIVVGMIFAVIFIVLGRVRGSGSPV